MTTYSLSYNDLKAEFKMFADGDLWGQTMNWWFSLAATLVFDRGADCPSEWQYRAPAGDDRSEDDYAVDILKQAATDDLLKFGQLLSRYANFLARAGLSY